MESGKERHKQIEKECRKLTDGVLRERCLRRDDYTCVKCGSRENIDVHHKRYRIPPRLNDMITICKSCHRKLHAKGKRITAPVCCNCDSAQTYIRFSTKERVCRSCGHIQKLVKEEKKWNK